MRNFEKIKNQTVDVAEGTSWGYVYTGASSIQCLSDFDVWSSSTSDAEDVWDDEECYLDHLDTTWIGEVDRLHMLEPPKFYRDIDVAKAHTWIQKITMRLDTLSILDERWEWWPTIF